MLAQNTLWNSTAYSNQLKQEDLVSVDYLSSVFPLFFSVPRTDIQALSGAGGTREMTA